MPRSRSGYSSYRGRRTLNDILKWIAIVLLVLVILMLGGLLLSQKYMVSQDGDSSLDPPASSQEAQEPLDPGSVSAVVQPDGSQQEEEPDPVPQNGEPVLAALELPLEAVLDGTAPQLLEDAGANALILDMKNEEGRLAWVSQQSLAAQAKVNAQTDGINEILRQWNEGDVYTVARVCCFRDNSVPYQRNDVALRASYGNWRDELGLRWMNPASADAQAYLAGLCGELADLGFDEIVLDCCGFPTQGNLTAISTEVSSPTQVMDGFLSLVSQELESYDTVLSVRTERAVLIGEDTLSGLTASSLETYAGRLWMTADQEEPALQELLANAGLTQPEKRLVTVTAALAAEEQTPQAVFAEP